MLFKLPNIQNADIVQPFIPIKASKNKQLFRPNDAGRMSLSACRSVFGLYRMRPGVALCVKNIKIIRTTPTIVAAKEIHFVSN